MQDFGLVVAVMLSGAYHGQYAVGAGHDVVPQLSGRIHQSWSNWIRATGLDATAVVA